MNDCIFCKVIERKVPAKIEREEKEWMAIQDINPKAPVHLLIIPKTHIEKIDDLSDEQAPFIGRLIVAAKKMAAQKNVAKGYRLVFNNGAEAGQSVFHIHLHLLGGRPMTWPPG